ncbi:TniB family NTP-binding protein [Streptomyces sp. NPDC001667]
MRWQVINDYGIRFGYRTYDDKVLNGYRRRRSGCSARGERWEVHYNPYAPERIWVRLPHGFVEVPWIHVTQVSLPFTDYTWRHIRKTVARTADRDAHELALARALEALLKRARAGHGTRRERTVAARAMAAAALSQESQTRDTAGHVSSSAPVPDIAGARWPLDGEGEELPHGLDGFDEGEADDEELPMDRVSRLLDPRAEASQWVTVGAGGVDADERFDPVSTWMGWQRYVDSAPVTADVDDSGWSREQRLDYHSQFVVVSTPAMEKVSVQLQRMLLLNRRHRGTARRGLIVSGPPNTGKTTTLMELGRIFELADRRKHPEIHHDRLPVAFVSVPPASTPKMLVSEFARFLGLPVLQRMNQAGITDAVCTALCELRSQLVLVDDVHLLDTRTRSGAETSDQIKHLGERIPATFVYAGVEVDDSPLLTGPRGQQLAGRFKLLRNDPLPYGTQEQRQVWNELVSSLENALRLQHHRAGTLARHSAYLHRRTAGVIGSLSHLIREAAMVAVLDGTQGITKTLLEDIDLDIRAQQHLLAAPAAGSRARPATRTRPQT